jgi:hypothetical protein
MSGRVDRSIVAAPACRGAATRPGKPESRPLDDSVCPDEDRLCSASWSSHRVGSRRLDDACVVSSHDDDCAMAAGPGSPDG